MRLKRLGGLSFKCSNKLPKGIPDRSLLVDSDIIPNKYAVYRMDNVYLANDDM
jgi:hypothetical protein